MDRVTQLHVQLAHRVGRHYAAGGDLPPDVVAALMELRQAEADWHAAAVDGGADAGGQQDG